MQFMHVTVEEVANCTGSTIFGATAKPVLLDSDSEDNDNVSDCEDAQQNF